MQGPPGYQDPDAPDVGMPCDDDDDTPDLGGTGSGGLPPQLPPDLSSDGIELQYGPGGFPPHYPGSRTLVPVPDDAEPAVAVIPDGGDDDDDHPPGGPPDAPGARQTFANPDQYMQPQPHVPASQPVVPIPKHPHFPISKVTRPPAPRNVPLTRSTGAHPEDQRPKTKLRFPDVTGIQPPPVRVVSKPKAKAEPVVIQPPAPVALPGQGLKEKGPPIDPDIEPANKPGSSSAGPPAIPGLPVTEGEFPIIQQSPAPHDAVPIPKSGSESDSDRTVDYRDDAATLLALVESSEDVLLQLPDDFHVPDFVPLDGDGFASWPTRQDKIKAGSVTPEMARRYAKEIRMAKLDEFKRATWTTAPCAWRTSGSFHGMLISLLVVGFSPLRLTKAVTFRSSKRDGYVADSRTSMPGSSRPTVLLLLAIVCLRPVCELNDAPRRWWNRLDKFLRSIGLEPTRADRCTYVAYQGTEKRHNASIAQGCGTLIPAPSSGDPGASSYLNEVALSAQRRNGPICPARILLHASNLFLRRR